MKQKGSLYIGKVFGIDLVVHWMFWLLLIFILYSSISDGYGFEEGIYRVFFVLAVFVCVVLHELGHALMARKFGCPTRQIVLLPIGGMAQMDKIPQKPYQELLVAFAGPLVSFAIALFVYFILSFDQSSYMLEEDRYSETILASGFLFNLFVINLILAIFNLIPAFPMDGGRMLRALLSMKFPRAKATRIAAIIGQMIAVVFVIWGYNHNMLLAFIGIFIFLAARKEAAMETGR